MKEFHTCTFPLILLVESAFTKVSLFPFDKMVIKIEIKIHTVKPLIGSKRDLCQYEQISFYIGEECHPTRYS